MKKYILTERQYNIIKRRSLLSENQTNMFPKSEYMLDFSDVTLSEFISKMETFLFGYFKKNKGSTSPEYIKHIHETLKHLKILNSTVSSDNVFNSNFSKFINLFYRPNLKTIKGQLGYVLRLVNSGTELSNLFITIHNIVGIMNEKGVNEYQKNRHLKNTVRIILTSKDEDPLPKILTYFENLDIRPSKVYEDSFSNLGFHVKGSQPRITKNTGDITKHSLNGDGEASLICNEIVSNINEYLTTKSGDKYDITYNGEGINYEGETLISNGDLIEVKYLPYTSDSYLSEFMAIGKSSTVSKHFNAYADSLERYNQIIGCVYNRINNDEALSKRILTHLMGNIKGIFFQDYIYVPKEGIIFYITDKGMSNKQKRLTVRFRVNNNTDVYKFNKEEGGSFGVTELASHGTNESEFNYIGEVPKQSFIGSKL